MEISVFDDQKRVVLIHCHEIIHIHRSGGRLCYRTNKGVYYGSRTLAEEAELRFERNFRIIDKNSLLNMDKVTSIENGVAYVNETKYLISRRRLATIERIWKGLQRNYR